MRHAWELTARTTEAQARYANDPEGMRKAFGMPSPTSDSLLISKLKGHGAESVTQLQPEFRSRLGDLFANAPPEIQGQLSITSGYRSVERQKELWDAAVKKYGSEDAARKWVAPPGNSFHNKGAAADLGFGSDEARKWVHDNAGKFGLAFHLDNENWHIEMAGGRDGSVKAEPRFANIPLDQKQQLVRGAQSQLAGAKGRRFPGDEI